ncbi:MAG TPA: beta-ketoacyl synthase N-terminal-like domain-containing protein, partial [Polyangiales bacterium]
MTTRSLVSTVLNCVARACGRAPGEFSPNRRFRDQGIDSLTAVRIVNELSQELGRPLPATLLWEQPSIAALATFLDHEADAETSARSCGVTPAWDTQEPIAIVGMGCRLPTGIDSPEALWRALLAGVSAVTEVPATRWDVRPLFHADPAAPGKLNTRWGSFLHDVAGFDAGFFGISPKEAAQMDPQQRLALEVSWEALEDAGVVPETLQGSRTGVFFGAWTQDYAQLHGADPHAIAQHSAVGWNTSIIPARIAYGLGLHGPVMTVNTACSSSLVAIHIAVQSLQRGESELALVGATNLILSPDVTIQMAKLGAMSPSGKCRAFDAGADGYVRGEGCGVVVLRRLSDALARGERIYALVRGSAVNSDGASNGLTAPSPAAQVAVLTAAWREAAVRPDAVSYVETHGPGTLLGDPIEAGALGSVFGPAREQPLLLGSVKTNFGHLESAAGLLGLLKASLTLFHGQLPHNLHFEQPNPHIAFDQLKLRVIDTPRCWPDVARRYAGVSSFGYGGTNAHVALEEPPSRRGVVLPLAADSEVALQALAAQLREQLAQVDGDAGLRSFMAPHGRGMVRAALRGRHPDALRHALEALACRESARLHATDASERPRLVFVFSGHGSQWPGMARDLLASEPTFARALARCSRAIQAAAGPDVWNALRAHHGASSLDRTDVIQPALFAIQVALAETLAGWGVRPDLVLGQSVGEVAAAVVAGALTLDQGALLIVRWSRLVQERVCGHGGMLVAELSAAAARQLLADAPQGLWLSGTLAPHSVSFAGTREALDRLQTTLAEQG